VGDISDEEKSFNELHSTMTEIEQKLSELENNIFT
jgi:peptidoglycan hydrolase CwlO-like protein